MAGIGEDALQAAEHAHQYLGVVCRACACCLVSGDCVNLLACLAEQMKDAACQRWKAAVGPAPGSC